MGKRRSDSFIGALHEKKQKTSSVVVAFSEWQHEVVSKTRQKH